MATTLTPKNIALGVAGGAVGATAGFLLGRAISRRDRSTEGFASEGLAIIGALIGLVTLPAIADAAPTPNPLSNTPPTQIPPAGAVGDS